MKLVCIISILACSLHIIQCDVQCPFFVGNHNDATDLNANENNLPFFTCATAPTSCFSSKYRSFDGSCNNLNNRGWGMANTRYARLLTPNYGDAFSSPSLAVSGDSLPGARRTSNQCFKELELADNNYTLINMQWGQTVAHDMSLLAGSTVSIRKLTKCCTADGKMMNASDLSHFCFPIPVPKDDPYGSKYNIECQHFVRTLTDYDLGCDGVGQIAAVDQISIVTPFIDLSFVYGESIAWSSQLRTFNGGLLRANCRFDQDFLPDALDNYDACNIASPNETCYFAGDGRVNQNTGLVVLSTLLLREHNRLANGLSQINPHWSDERLFQEARRINIAEYQAITYYEWLPILLGKANLTQHGIIYSTTDGGFVNDYNSSVNPAVLNEHAHACFRYAHSQIAGTLQLMLSDGSSNSSIRLSDFFYKPSLVADEHNFDRILHGLTFQPQQSTDNNYNPEIRDFWFRMGRPVGDDLRAIDIQRNRDHGLRSFNDYRVWSGKARATKWEDYLDTVSQKTLNNWQIVYGSFDDVDLTIGASSERHEPNTLGGPLLNSIMIEQFYRTRVADRFFFENGGDASIRFTLDQLKQIRKSTLAGLICSTGKDVTQIQSRSFELVSESNPLVDCSTISTIDLSVWIETVPDLTC